MQFDLAAGSGHTIVLDDGEGDGGARPTEALLAVAGGMHCDGRLLAADEEAPEVHGVRGRGTRRAAAGLPARLHVDRARPRGRGCRHRATVAVRRSIELSATKYCPISAMISAGPTEIHHRYPDRGHRAGADGGPRRRGHGDRAVRRARLDLHVDVASICRRMYSHAVATEMTVMSPSTGPGRPRAAAS